MYLGIDIGASYCKAAVIDQNYNLLHTVRNRMPNPIDPKNVKLVEYNVDEILYLVYDVIKSMSITVEKKIDWICISGQMHGMLLLDDSNKPITNFISWQDKRTTEKLSLGQDTYLEFLRNSLKKYRSLTGIDLKPGMMGPIRFWFKKKGYFLYVGNISVRKNIINLLKAYALNYLSEDNYKDEVTKRLQDIGHKATGTIKKPAKKITIDNYSNDTNIKALVDDMLVKEKRHVFNKKSKP